MVSCLPLEGLAVVSSNHINCSITSPRAIVLPAAVGDGRLVVVTEREKNKNPSLMGMEDDSSREWLQMGVS